MENEKKLKVHMLSNFCIIYGKKAVDLDEFGNSKLLELLQILLRYKKTGISRSQLLQMLYEDDSVEDKNHSLDSLSYRLKRVLKQTGIEQDEFVQIKNGIFKWVEQIPLDVDVLEFEELADRSLGVEGEEKKALLTKAFSLYDSEFLGEKQLHPWIVEERIRLKKIYKTCIHDLGAILEKEENYPAMYELFSKAVQIYPYDEWQTEQIRALQYLEKYSEAYELYQDTVKKYIDELGLPPSQKMLEIIQRMGDHLRNPIEPVEEIKNRLEEGADQRGAYYCTYPGFKDLYNYVSRMVERSGKSVFFMMCSYYYINPSGRKSSKAGDKLMEAIQTVLRKGDSFTRYSDHQYLILLTGAQNENCEIIFERIRKYFKQVNRNTNCELEYFATELPGAIEEGKTLSFRSSKSRWTK